MEQKKKMSVIYDQVVSLSKLWFGTKISLTLKYRLKKIIIINYK